MFDFITSIVTYTNIKNNLLKGNIIEFIPLFILLFFIGINELIKLFKK